MKLAFCAWLFLTEYVTTTACDAVSEQLCGVRVTGVVAEPPMLTDAVPTESDGFLGFGACTGTAAPSVITNSLVDGTDLETSVGLSLLQAATIASAAKGRTDEYLTGVTPLTRVPAPRGRACPTSVARAVSMETPGFADRPRGRGAILGRAGTRTMLPTPGSPGG